MAFLGKGSPSPVPMHGRAEHLPVCGAGEMGVDKLWVHRLWVQVHGCNHRHVQAGEEVRGLVAGCLGGPGALPAGSWGHPALGGQCPSFPL